MYLSWGSIKRGVSMDLISIILFVLTMVLIGSIVFLDLSKYKYYYFGAIIVLGVALYTYGLIYQDPNPNYLDVVLKAFGNTSQILRGIFRTSEIMPRINNDLLFLISAYAIHVLGFGYTYILVFAIFFKNLNLRMRFHLQKVRPHVLVLADDDRIKYFMESFDANSLARHKRFKMNVALSKTLLQSKEIKTNYRYKPGVTSFDVQHQSLAHLLGNDTQSYIVSLITKEEDVLALIAQLNTYFRKHPSSTIKVYVLYNQDARLPVYESFSEYRHRINFFSYHQLVARSFLFDYPLTRLLPYGMIQTEKASLKKASIAYHLVGYGLTNQAIYQHLYTTNQFPNPSSSLLSDWFGKEPLHYHLYDRRPIPEPKNSLNRAQKLNKNELPLPNLSSQTHTHTVQRYIEGMLPFLNQKHDAQFVIIALDSDLENLQILQEVRDYVLKFKLHSKVTIFVQLMNKTYADHSQLFQDSFIHVLGQGDAMYNLRHIISPTLTTMAENIFSLLHPKDNFDRLQFQEKKAYLYEAVSIRFRLNLMGFDLVQQDKGISERRYLEAYDPLQLRPENLDHLRARNDADIAKYFPKKITPRSLLAQQEHLRQSAFGLSQGYIPMRLNDFITHGVIRHEETNEDVRITTFESLGTIQKALREKRGASFPESDVIYPYFVTFDHLYLVLKNTPFKVIDKIAPHFSETLELSMDELPSIQSRIKD